VHYGIFITTTSFSAEICFYVTIFLRFHHAIGRFHNGFQELKVTITYILSFFCSFSFKSSEAFLRKMSLRDEGQFQVVWDASKSVM